MLGDFSVLRLYVTLICSFLHYITHYIIVAKMFNLTFISVEEHLPILVWWFWIKSSTVEL